MVGLAQNFYKAPRLPLLDSKGSSRSLEGGENLSSVPFKFEIGISLRLYQQQQTMAMVLDSKTDLSFPYWTSIRRRFAPDSSFFAPGNLERELLAKQIALDLTEDEKHQLQKMMVDQDTRELFCPIVGCGTRLASLEDFENHYNARHSASCSVCSRVYPTSRLLGIHLSEVHDSFFQAKVARGYDVYECLVEGCGLKFKSYKSRQQHLVDKHKFPTSFEFFNKARPSKKQRQKQHSKQALRGKDESSSTMEVEDETINGLVSAVSKLSTSDSSPSTISFGHRHSRGFTFVPRSIQHEKRLDSTAAETQR